MHGVVRRYRGASTLGDAMAGRSQEVRDIIGGVPGFVAYYATRDGGTVTTVTVCDDRAGTQESTRRAGEWVRQNLPRAGIGALEIIEGETFLQL